MDRELTSMSAEVSSKITDSFLATMFLILSCNRFIFYVSHRWWLDFSLKLFQCRFGQPLFDDFWWIIINAVLKRKFHSNFATCDRSDPISDPILLLFPFPAFQDVPDDEIEDEWLVILKVHMCRTFRTYTSQCSAFVLQIEKRRLVWSVFSAGRESYLSSHRNREQGSR